jgi:hypothetical protein
MHTKYRSVNFRDSGNFDFGVDGILELQLKN